MTEDTDPKRVVGRITASMLLLGVGIGLASILIWEWIEAVLIVEATDGSSRELIGSYTPLVFLVIASLSTVISSAVLGIFEGIRSSSRRDAAFIGLGCLLGGVLLVMIAGPLIGTTGLESGGGAEITPLDLLGLAGLAGVASLPIGALASLSRLL